MEVLNRESSDFAANSEIIFVKAAYIDQVFRITITAPMSKPADDVAPHGLITLDGNLLSTAAPGIVNALSMGRVIPPQVTVTIGYPLDSLIVWNNLRVRDLTPTSNPEFSALQTKLFGNECPDGGGAAAFLSFIQDELKPFVEQEYGVVPGEWTLTGASFGGLFSTFAMLTNPDHFKRHNILNPSVWFRAPFMQDLARAFAAGPSPTSTSAIFIAGAMETREQQEHHFINFSADDLAPIGGVPDMTLDMMEVAAIIRRRSGVRLSTLTIANEDHFSVIGSGLTQGLRWLYSKKPSS